MAKMTQFRSIPLFLFLFLFFLLPPRISAENVEYPDLRRLEVVGEAEILLQADLLRISLGVITQDEDPNRALTKNNQRMRAVTEALRQAGLSEEEYKTGRFQIHPVYSHGRTGMEVPEITRYRINNSINISTKKLQLAGDMITAAVAAGANSFHSAGFDLSNPEYHKNRANTLAIQNATNDARAAAEAAGVKLGRILKISIEDRGFRGPPELMMRTAAVTEDAGPTPLKPGDVSLRSQVRMIFELTDL